MDKKADARQIEKNIGAALFSDTERMEMWFAAYWKKAALIALALVVVFCGLLFWYQTAARRERELLRKISNSYNIDELRQLIAGNPKSSGINFGRYRLARILISEKEYTQAEAVFKEIISSGKAADSLLNEKARLGLGYCLEMQNKFVDGAAIFQSIADDEAVSLAARAEAECAAMRLFIENGDFDKAENIAANNSRIPENRMTSYWKAQMHQMSVALKNGEYTAKK